MTNMFNQQGKKMQGKVVVRTRPSNLVEGAIIQHVVRNTADDAVVISTMTEHTDIVKSSDMVTVISAFVSAVQDIVANGNAVRVSGLGTFYLTSKETEEGGSEFDIAFAADKSLTEAAQKAHPELTLPSESLPAIENVQDMSTMAENGEVTAEGFVLLDGKRMRVAGDNAETGIYMVPCDDDGNYRKDKSDWVKADDKYICRNYMKEVIFRVPNVSGKHRIAIVTKTPLNGSTREDKLLKRAKTGVSEVVTVV